MLAQEQLRREDCDSGSHSISLWSPAAQGRKYTVIGICMFPDSMLVNALEEEPKLCLVLPVCPQLIPNNPQCWEVLALPDLLLYPDCYL